jgi:CHAD domain-containing protein
MSPSPKSTSRAAPPAVPAEHQRPTPTLKLNPTMACDTAFRVVARRCLENLIASHEGTCSGDPGALHQMRIALTRLRTAIVFFSPMVDDPERARIRDELKWLNSQLGTVRDLDVAIERLKAASGERPQAISHYQQWNEKRADSHRHLARALRSARYRRLVEGMFGWVANGPWSIKEGKQAKQERATPIAAYSTRKLTQWEEKILKKRRKLLKMGTKKRHRLRLMNKKICYSIEAFEDLFPDKKFSKQEASLKYLRKAQKSLGRLNDDANGHSLAIALKANGGRAPLEFLSAKREKRLIRTAAAAYRKLAALKPFRDLRERQDY